MADSAKREPATFQEIRDILRQVSESQKETDRRLQETDRLLKRHAQEADRRFRGLDELFNGQWGKLMEVLVEGDLIDVLQARGIEVEHTLTNVRHRGERSWEFDIIAVNGAEVVVVEVKTTLKVRQVDRFVGLMQEFTDLMPRYRGSTVYAAVAYLKADEASDSYAERQGLFVIRATGSSASITNREGFTPRAFAT